MPVGVYNKVKVPRPCERCGQEVPHREVIDHLIEEEIWSPEPHFAGCGLPCLSAGDVRRAQKKGAVGLLHSREGCPACDQGLGLGLGEG